MAVADVVIAYLMFSVIPISIILGAVNLVQFQRFYILRNKMDFLQKRKPPLIIIYCVIGLLSSTLTLPYVTFVHILHSHPNTNSSPIEWLNNIPETARSTMINTGWIFQFIHEISTCFLLILIAIRSWCLYVDYKFAIASTDFINWRIHVNATETNMWIKYKKYFANYKLILYIISTLSVFILSIFIILHFTIDLHLYGFMADFTVAVPVSIFIFWLYLKIKNTKDQYMIKYELQRLCVCVSIIILSFFIWISTELLCKLSNAETVDIHLLMYAIDIIFVFCTVYFQTQWVIQQANTHKTAMAKRTLNHATCSNVHSYTKSNTKDASMVDVLRSKNGFNAFVNHCVAEVNVESLLFLVEVSQFKATISQFHRDELLESCHIDVVKENLYRILLAEKRQKQEAEQETEQALSRVSSLKKRVSAMIKGMPGISTIGIEHVNTTTIHSNASVITDASNNSPYQAAADHSLETGGGLTQIGKQTNIKQRRSNTLQEDTFKRFQQDILERDWLPISAQLKIDNNTENLETEEEKKLTIKPDKIDTWITPPPSNHGTPISTNSPSKTTMRFSQLKHLSIGEVHPNAASKLNCNSPSNSSPSNRRISDKNVIIECAGESKDDEKSQKKVSKKITMRESFKQIIKTKSISTVETVKETLSPNWMFERLYGLYTKYIQISGPLCVNLSSETRHSLVSFFSLKPEQSFDFIRNHNFHQLTREEKELIAADNDYDILMIKTFLYHCFDVAFNDIWGLIRDDVFLRFISTKQYQELHLAKSKNKTATSRTSSVKQTPRNSIIRPMKSATPIIMETGNMEATPNETEQKFTFNDLQNAKFSSYSEEEDIVNLDGLMIVEDDKIIQLQII